MAKPRSRVKTTLDGKILENYITADHSARDRKYLWSFFCNLSYSLCTAQSEINTFKCIS